MYHLIPKWDLGSLMMFVTSQLVQFSAKHFTIKLVKFGGYCCALWNKDSKELSLASSKPLSATFINTLKTIY